MKRKMSEYVVLSQKLHFHPICLISQFSLEFWGPNLRVGGQNPRSSLCASTQYDKGRGGPRALKPSPSFNPNYENENATLYGVCKYFSKSKDSRREISGNVV